MEFIWFFYKNLFPVCLKLKDFLKKFSSENEWIESIIDELKKIGNKRY